MAKHNPARGVADVTRATKVLNDRTAGAGDQLSQVIGHLSKRLDAQGGHHGTVAIAKQTVKDSNNRARPGLNLNGMRLTGVAEPIEGKDIVTLDYWRRFESCDSFRQRVEDCVKFERKALVGGAPERFEPTGSVLFVDQVRDRVYYIHVTQAGSNLYNERAGALGVIDVTDKHAPVRTNYLVVTRFSGPLGFAVDPVRRIGFVRNIVKSTPGATDNYLMGSYDFNTLDVITPIQLTGRMHLDYPEVDFGGGFPLMIGNKEPETSATYGYYHNTTFQNGGGPFPIPRWQVSWSRFYSWNFTDPAGMYRIRDYDVGGYHVSENRAGTIPSDLGVHGLHRPLVTDHLGRGTLATHGRTWAVNWSAGNTEFNFTLRSDMFINQWDITDPGNIFLSGRVNIGPGVELGGSYSVQQVSALVMWKTNVFAVISTYEPDKGDTFAQNTFFAIDCSTGTPIVKSRWRHPCGSIGGLAVWENCVYIGIGPYHTVWDASDLTNLVLIGGCRSFSGGYPNYRPGYLYALSAFGIPSPGPGDPNSRPGIGFTIMYFGESGINCP